MSDFFFFFRMVPTYVTELIVTQLRGAFDTFIDNASRVGAAPETQSPRRPSDAAMCGYLDKYVDFNKDRGACVRPGR